jgi:hypothetical protein
MGEVVCAECGGENCGVLVLVLLGGSDVLVRAALARRLVFRPGRVTLMARVSKAWRRETTFVLPLYPPIMSCTSVTAPPAR